MNQLQQFASRMIDRLLIDDGGNELNMIKKHVFAGISGQDTNTNSNNRKRKLDVVDVGDNDEPCLKKRKYLSKYYQL